MGEREMTMVERVAKAMFRANPGGDIKIGNEDWRKRELSDCPGAVGIYQRMARAALEAMREPTKAMREGEGINRFGSPEDLIGYLDHFTADAVWRGMIDAALSEPPALFNPSAYQEP